MRDLAFIQKQGFTMHEFILKEDRISVKSCSINGMKSRSILLDDLGHKTEIEKDSKWMGCGLFLLFFCFPIMFITGNIVTHSEQVSTWLWITISMFSAFLSIFILTTPVKNEIRLVGGNESLVLLFDKPSEKEVRDFIDEIIRRSKRILLRKYGTIDPDLPEQQMISQLNWLFELEVITKDAFDKLKSEYLLMRSHR
jgi:hypothetical protein